MTGRMPTALPFHVFLGEIADISAWIADVIDCPKRSSWHWPSFYLLYVEIDRMRRLISSIGCQFASPLMDPVHALDEGTAAEGAAEEANRLFGELTQRQKAVVQGLFQIARRTAPNPANPAPHLCLVAHVHPKSGWYQVFMDDYRSGDVSADGKTLTRTVLPAVFASCIERIDHIAALCMREDQVFDLGVPGMGEALAQTADDAARRLGKIADAMRMHLVGHCTVHDLMHPSSH